MQKHSLVFLIHSSFAFLTRIVQTPGADPGGGGAGGISPPRKNKGAKNHTHRQKKSDNHEARYRLKRTPNTH